MRDIPRQKRAGNDPALFFSCLRAKCVCAAWFNVCMNNDIELSKRYHDIGCALIMEREDLQYLEGVRIAFLASDQEKKSGGRTIFGECRKVSPLYAWCCPYDFMITIYEPNLAEYHFDDDMVRILIWHELLHCGVDETEKGPKYKIMPHDVEEFDRIIGEEGLHWARKYMRGADPRG